MIKNLFKIAIRNIWIRKFFSLINIMGLTIGIACFFLIIVNVRDEFSYDNFHENKDRIYRVALERIYPDNVVFYSVIPFSIGEAMQTDFPEVENMTRLLDPRQSVVFQYEDKTYEEDKILFAEPNFFDVFSVTLIMGDQEKVFSTQNSIVMTEEKALKYFADEDPIGKILTIPQGELMVSGVMENVPKNSHLEFDFLVSMALTGIQNQPNYVSFSAHTYIVVKEGTSPGVIEEKMPVLVERYAAGQIQAQTGQSFAEYTAAGNGYNYFLQPIQDIHLHSNLNSEIKPNGNITYVYVQIAIAFFLITIACINFMNLATAQSTSRAREVGIRKIVGSTRGCNGKSDQPYPGHGSDTAYTSNFQSTDTERFGTEEFIRSIQCFSFSDHRDCRRPHRRELSFFCPVVFPAGDGLKGKIHHIPHGNQVEECSSCLPIRSLDHPHVHDSHGIYTDAIHKE